ncbi:hypothetical protein [Mesobacillus jeotgali]|uniref:hypothetical protein n=1 Tax=Mesobacillus jeotgali TaxID=129985 RepID=UPI0009A7EF7B|nr:hypothetical protein [Mesobacillus jeotgali]
MEFLFDILTNPIALFILIGAISSLFNQKKRDGNHPQRRPVRPSGPFQPPGPPPVRRQPAEARIEPQRPEMEKDQDYDPGLDARREEGQGRGTGKKTPVKSGVETITDLQKKYQERKRQSDEPGKKQNTGRMSSGESSGRLKQKREQVTSDVVFQPDRDTLVEGLIWAEVLGKPRAKKPFNQARRL